MEYRTTYKSYIFRPIW